GFGRDTLRSEVGEITPISMMNLLRNCESGICMHGGFRSTASMVSQLFSSKNDVHWMTGTPHPCRSMFKPLTFPLPALDHYQPASNKPDLNSVWWVHEKLSEIGTSKYPNWRSNEKELYSKTQNVSREQFNTISSEAFTTEQDEYKSLLKNSS
ncbi:MAG: hypothetical protein ACW98F_17585, partial [Candidatus Hodarchaeales archaeon]